MMCSSSIIISMIEEIKKTNYH